MDAPTRKLISVYADGSSTGDAAGPMGWGWLITDWDTIITAGSAGAISGTNNVAELQAAIAGLRAVVDLKLHIGNDVELVSDSTYALGLASGAYFPQKNQDVVKILRDLFLATGARTRWVRGHSGDVFNDKCDELAKAGRDKYTPQETRKRRRSRKREERRRKRAIVKAYKVRVYGFKPGRSNTWIPRDQ
jgi:ribonuclease HI